MATSTLREKLLAQSRAANPALAREIADATSAAANAAVQPDLYLPDSNDVIRIMKGALNQMLVDTESITPIAKMREKGHRTAMRSWDAPKVHLSGRLTEDGAEAMIKAIVYGPDGNDGLAGQINIKSPGNWKLADYSFDTEYAVSTRTTTDALSAQTGQMDAIRTSVADSTSERIALTLEFIETSGNPEIKYDANGNPIVDHTTTIQMPPEFAEALQMQKDTMAFLASQIPAKK